MTHRFVHDGRRIPQSPVNLHPTDNLSFGANWADELEENEVILTSSWTISPSTATIVTDGFTDTIASVLLSNGVVGTNYLITNRITTIDRAESRSFYIKCEKK